MKQQADKGKNENPLAGFPILAGLVALDAAGFKKEVDSLAASGRGLAGKPAAQRAVQEAVKVASELHRTLHR
jgi:hypothetical protein